MALHLRKRCFRPTKLCLLGTVGSRGLRVGGAARPLKLLPSCCRLFSSCRVTNRIDNNGLAHRFSTAAATSASPSEGEVPYLEGPNGKVSLQITNDEISLLPDPEFSGNTLIVSKPHQEPLALCGFQGETILGFDTETRPQFGKFRKRNPVALLQISSATHVVLYRMNKLKHIPPGLRAILSNPDIIKVGQDVRQDLHCIHESSTQHWRYSANVECHGFVDLLPIAKGLGLKPLNLRAQAAMLLGCKLDKRAQRSNWERPVLSPFVSPCPTATSSSFPRSHLHWQ